MKNLIKNIFLLNILILSFTLIGCANNKNSKHNISSNNIDAKKPTIAVSIVPEETFVKKVAGNLVNVISMIPAGQSPENFEPSPDLLEKFSNAKIYFTMNVPAENASILPKSKDFNSNVKIISLADEVRKVYKDREFSPGNRDPHIWLSPKRVKIMINVIKNELSTLDPKNKDIYSKNATDYINKLNKLDETIKQNLKNTKNKYIIVYHPSFGYFAEDYGLKMLALEKEGKEATPQDMQKIIDFAKKNSIKTVFYQAETDNKQAKTIATEIGGNAVQLSPLDANYINNLEKMSNAFNLH